MYAEEVKGLKEKIREMQKYEKHEEKSFKKQQEYLVILEGKYREVCEKAGVSASLNFTTSQEMNDRSSRFKSAKNRENSSSVGPTELKRIGVQSTKNLKKSFLDEQKNVKTAEDDKMEVNGFICMERECLFGLGLVDGSEIQGNEKYYYDPQKGERSIR